MEGEDTPSIVAGLCVWCYFVGIGACSLYIECLQYCWCWCWLGLWMRPARRSLIEHAAHPRCSLCSVYACSVYSGLVWSGLSGLSGLVCLVWSSGLLYSRFYSALLYVHSLHGLSMYSALTCFTCSVCMVSLCTLLCSALHISALRYSAYISLYSAYLPALLYSASHSALL